MEQTEQKISVEQLERLRKLALHQTKISYAVFILVFIVMMIFVTIKHVVLFKGLLASLVVAISVYCIYHVSTFQKTYENFNSKFKNQYVFQALQEASVFSDLKYSPEEGFAFEEIKKSSIVPLGNPDFFKSSDHLTGSVEEVPFNACNITTAFPPAGRSNIPSTVFSGQMLSFSLSEEQKISEGRLQIFPQKMETEMKWQSPPQKFETENTDFNERFSIHTDTEENALRLLTPQVTESIMEFADAAKEDIYIVFSDQFMLIACKQYHNPFSASVELPLEEQHEKILEITQIIQKACHIIKSIQA